MRNIILILVICHLLQIQLISAMPPFNNFLSQSPSEIPFRNSVNKNARILTVLFRQKRQLVPLIIPNTTKSPEPCANGERRDVLGRCYRGFAPKATSAKFTIFPTTNASPRDLVTNEITATTNQLPQPHVNEHEATTIAGKTQPASSPDETTRSVSPTTLVTRHPTVSVIVTSVKSEDAEASPLISTDGDNSDSGSHHFPQNDEGEEAGTSLVTPVPQYQFSTTTTTTTTPPASTTHEMPHKEHQRSIPDYVRTTHNCYGRDKTVLPSRAYEDYDY